LDPATVGPPVLDQEIPLDDDYGIEEPGPVSPGTVEPPLSVPFDIERRIERPQAVPALAGSDAPASLEPAPPFDFEPSAPFDFDPSAPFDFERETSSVRAA
jgi:hypothetical protein